MANRTFNEIGGNSIFLKVYALIFVFTALGTFTAYYFTSVPELVYFFLFLLFGGILFVEGSSTPNRVWAFSLVCLFLCSLYIAIDGLSFFPFVAFFFYSFLVCLDDRKKCYIFDVSNKVISLYIFISVVFWVIHLLGFSLPNTAIEYHGRDLIDYRFFLKSTNLFSNYRFQGLFAEPGHLGLVCALMLFPCKYNFKKREVWIYMVAVVLSLSLAAYLLSILGFLLYIISSKNIKKRTIYTIIICVVGLICIGYFYSRNNQDSLVYQNIYYRLEYSDGKINGDNRYSDDFESYYDSKMRSPNNALFGLGRSFNIEDFPANSGYKVFLIHYGWLGFLFVFMFYAALAKRYKTRISYALLLLYIVSFLQRPYIWSVLEIGIFIVSLAVINYKQVATINK